jgi:hypothetical protein
MLSFQTEHVEQFEPEVMPLLINHWQELGLDLDLEAAPDFAKMVMLENAGMWHILTVRDGKKLVGYLWALLTPHLHYKNSGPMLIVDAYYVVPEYRNGAGLRMLTFMESFARKMGAIKIYLSCKVHQDHSELFKRMGYRLSDYAFTKRI